MLEIVLIIWQKRNVAKGVSQSLQKFRIFFNSFICSQYVCDSKRKIDFIEWQQMKLQKFHKNINYQFENCWVSNIMSNVEVLIAYSNTNVNCEWIEWFHLNQIFIINESNNDSMECNVWFIILYHFIWIV